MKKITIEANGETYTLEGNWTTANDYAEVFKKVMHCVGFHPETIDSFIKD